MSLLDPDILIEKAHQLVRSSDLLGTEWQPAFRVLLQAIETEAGLSPARSERVVGEMLNLLSTRGRVAALLNHRPELRDCKMPAPAVITGLPRTGTTLLHNLMAVVPGNRAYRLWELRAPVFAIGAPVDQARRELQATQEILTWLYDQAPAFRGIHPMAADTPDECNWLLRTSFTTPFFSWLNYVPTYDEYLATADHRPAYRDWDLLLRLLRWRSPGGAPVLKDPGHIWALDALFDVRPDTRLIVMARDPASSVPSLCSLCATLQQMSADGPSDAEVGQYVLQMVTRGLSRLSRAVANYGKQIMVVDYRKLVAEPVATVRAIQQWLGRPFDSRAELACTNFLNNQRRAPKHRYSLEQYGLTRAQLPALDLPGWTA